MKSLKLPKILPLEYPPPIPAPHTRTGTSVNRLVRMVANTVVGPQQRMDFAYDHQGRRITNRVWNNTAGTGTSGLDQKVPYDGWNLVAVLGADNTLLRSFAWETDFSGTPKGAGGVGGLPGIHDLSTLNNQPSTHFVAHDGNGNVAALIKAGDGTESARYEYGPFGEVIRASGPMAKVNPFRFSTKHTDDERGLGYYAYSYYNAALGKWTTRDVAQEVGGRNLFAFALNCPVTFFDGLGDSVRSGQEFQMTVQLGIDLALIAPGVGPPLLNANPAICGLMVFWFGTNGRYDFGSAGNEWYGEEFNVPQMVTLRADQFSNFLAGYAGGYASFKGGTMFYAAAVMGAGELYDSISSYRDVSDGVSMRWNGLLNGIMDALDD